MFSAIAGAIGSLVSKPIEQWQKRKTLKAEHKFELERLDHKARLAKANKALEMAKQGQEQIYDLDRIAMENMNKSIKDEIVLGIFLVPVVLAFIPGMNKYVEAGFNAINGMPNWYIALVIGMVVVIYGMRGLLRAYIGNKSGKAIDKLISK